MSYADAIVWGLALFAVLVTFLNPGGLLVGLLIAFVILGARYGLPYVGQVYRDRQKGASAAKINQGARRRIRGGGGDDN